MKSLDKFEGCLIGGAIGDALGYAVEFLREGQIFHEYGSKGITCYDLRRGKGKALISDDTQMSLFTANGLLAAHNKVDEDDLSNEGYLDFIAACYEEWYRTQVEPYSDKNRQEFPYAWISYEPELFDRRAPGFTCLSSIAEGCIGTIENPINPSKGCGGVMRVAPIGLFFSDKPNFPPQRVMKIAAQCAALTHGHELGYIPAGVLAYIVEALAQEEAPSSIEKVVRESLVLAQEVFVNSDSLQYFIDLMNKAIDLAISKVDDLEAIHELGEGWVAEETLAIAIFCALKYPTDFEKGVIAAVNHNGDSDSTGAVTGNIIGANVGLQGIPRKFIDHLELKNLILEMAYDLYNHNFPKKGQEEEIWNHKYVQNDYLFWKQGKDLDHSFLKAFPQNKKMLGAIFGDVVGSPFEFINYLGKGFPLLGQESHPTDDSVLTLAVAKALYQSAPDYSNLEKNTVHWLQKLGRTYPYAGYGGIFSRWIYSSHPEPYNSWGNGAPMRVSAAGWFANSLAEARDLATKVSMVTHNHPEAIKAAQVVAEAIYLARNGATKESLGTLFERNYDLDFMLDDIRDEYVWDVSCMGTMPVALKAFLESTSFEDAMRNAVSIGGDSDTISAITASIAEAYYGINQNLVEALNPYLDEFFQDTLKTINTYLDQKEKGK